jgi:hypothetical protein
MPELPELAELPDDQDQDYLPAPVSRETQLRRVAAMLAARSVPGPPGIREPAVLRRFMVEEDEPGTFIGTIGVQLLKHREKRRRTEPVCAYCGLTHHSGGLYRVSSPAMPREQILCYAHMLTETTIAGSVSRRIT